MAHERSMRGDCDGCMRLGMCTPCLACTVDSSTVCGGRVHAAWAAQLQTSGACLHILCH